MKKLFLLFAITLSTSLFAQQNVLSTTALAIKQDPTTKTITVLQLSSNPAFGPSDVQPNSVVPVNGGLSLKPTEAANGVIDALSQEANFDSLSGDLPYPAGYVILVWEVKNESGCGCSFIWSYAFPDTGNFNGQFLAYTNSLTTVRDTIINKLYSGL